MGEKYQSYSDEELIRLYRAGDGEIMDYLLEKYKNLVKAQAGKYFIKGADEQDVLQEGMIGLFKAVRDFDESKHALFSTFARICIENNIKTAIEKAGRKKQEMLNNSYSLNAESPTGEMNEEVAGLRRLGIGDPEEIFIDQENYHQLKKNIEAQLSHAETEVFKLMLQGFTYREIAAKLKRTPKSVDNSITRIKNKARMFV